MKIIHSIQQRILKDLLFAQELRFVDLKPIYMESSQFMFHLKKLIASQLITKISSGYSLTEAGKEFANRADTSIKVTIILCAVKNKSEYLIYKRLKNPFFGCVGFPTTKVNWGEDIFQAAKRGLHEETGLIGEPLLFAIRHYKIFKDEKPIEDKLMHAFVVEDPSGTLEPSDQGEYFWVKDNELKSKMIPPLVEFWDIYIALKGFSGAISFNEISVKNPLSF